MKAVVVDRAGGLEVAELHGPRPRPGELLLRVRACGVGRSALERLLRDELAPGAVPGHEFAGEVVESAHGFAAGQRVTAIPTLSCGACRRCRSGFGSHCASGRAIGTREAPGALAELVSVAAHEAVRLPESVGDLAGALVEPMAVGLHAVNTARIRNGEVVGVLGAGPIGLAILIWARHFGAKAVVVAETSPLRRALASSLGASSVVDPAESSLAAELTDLRPEGPDVVFEAVGGPGMLQEAVDAVGYRGRVVGVGTCLAPDRFHPSRAVAKEASLRFSLAYEKDDFQYTVDMLDQGRIDPAAMVTGHADLDELPALVPALLAEPEPCKLMVLPDRSLVSGW